MRRLRVVAVQPELSVGDVEGNLAHVEQLVRAAAAEHGPDLIVLPEALGSPNVYHPALRSVPRSVDGPLIQMLTRLARELDCVIAGGALTVRGGHAYGTYVMAEPDGAMHLHDKDQPSGTECYDYRGGDDDGTTTASTWDGVAVGLVSGMEWTRSATARRLRDAEVQIVIGGQCWPWTPLNWKGAVGRASARLHADSVPLLRQTPPTMARMTGVPTVMGSLVGPVTMNTPYLPGVPFHTEIIGQTMICDRDGTVLAHRGYEEGEGWICAEVELGPPTPSLDVPPTYWSVPVPAAISAAFHTTNVLGRIHYTARHARRGFPWQKLPKADLPDEWPASPATDTPSARNGPIRRLPDPTSQRVLAATVVRREEVADRVVRLSLARSDGRDLPDWTPGSHVDLVLPDGVVRQYSLCGDTRDRSTWQTAVLLEPDGRGGSRAAHALAVGDRVELRGPRNNFALTDSPGCLFIAGGIGITPIRPMVHEAERAGLDWRLLYGGRSRSAMAFVDELEAIGPDRVCVTTEDETGLLDLESALHDIDPATEVYCCGPPGLVAAVLALAPAAHVERFVAQEVSSPRRPFTAVLARTQRTIDVPAHRSLLEAAQDAGATIDSSCQDGVCGSCRVTVLDGTPEHRDSILSAEEQETAGAMYPCVSRAVGHRLVIDV